MSLISSHCGKTNIDFLNSLYFSIITITTLSCRDIISINILMLLEFILGMALISLFIISLYREYFVGITNTKVFQLISAQKPQFYGMLYIAAIFIYTVIFSLFSSELLELGKHDAGFMSGFYFSVITITTLGYGDITPANYIGQFITASESVLGIVLIGLFLNALSHQQAEEVKENEKQAQARNDKVLNLERILAFDKLIKSHINMYLSSIPAMIQTQGVKKQENDLNKMEYILHIDFSFKDMKQIYSPCPVCNPTNLSTLAIDIYINRLQLFATSLENMITSGVDLQNKEVEELYIDFINRSRILYLEFPVLKQIHSEENSKAIAEAAELIAKYEFEQDIHEEILEARRKNKYYILYVFIKGSFEFIKTYNQFIKEQEEELKKLEENTKV